jgi:hypothetical protein
LVERVHVAYSLPEPQAKADSSRLRQRSGLGSASRMRR